MERRQNTNNQMLAASISFPVTHSSNYSFNRDALSRARYEHLVTDAISIGDYVLTGGELPAIILIDAVSRLIPGVLGDPTGAEDDSHSMGLLEYQHYTKPSEFRDWKVPDVLLSGDHARIEKWRREQALLRTFNKRPDMLEKAELSEKDLKFVEGLKSNVNDRDI